MAAHGCLFPGVKAFHTPANGSAKPVDISRRRRAGRQPAVIDFPALSPAVYLNELLIAVFLPSL
jgi:hypothetical protein